MPAQLGEIVTFQAQWSVLGVPTGSLSPTPTITVYAPDGSVLVNAANMTALGSSMWYGYIYTLPMVAGEYKVQPFCSQSGLDVAYLPPIVLAVGQAWIQNLDAAISSIATSVWGFATRILTAGTNIVLAKGTGLTGLNDISTTQVHTEFVNALTVDTYAEPSAPPAATASIKDMVNWVKMLGRNKLTQTSTQQKVYADDNTTIVSTSTVSDDGTVATRSKAS